MEEEIIKYNCSHGFMVVHCDGEFVDVDDHLIAIKKAKEKEKERIYYGIISIFEEFKEKSPTYSIGLFMKVVLKELKLKEGK